MTAKLYARIPSAKPAKPLGPQAKIVWNALTTVPTLAADVDRKIVESTPFRTRQDSLRVTLYYILVFKKAGLVSAHEPVEGAEPENAFAGLVSETSAA